MKKDVPNLTLEEMLLLTGLRARTGELTIEAGNNIGTVLFLRGDIRQAFSPYSRAIGDLLVENGVISDTELIETLKLQKRNEYVPLGALLVRMGRVTIDVVEHMVHEQIRQSIGEFQSWKNAHISFLDKELKPFDHIHLTTHEFISPSLLESARLFLSQPVSSHEDGPRAATAPSETPL